MAQRDHVLLNVHEAAAALRISVRHLRMLMARGEIAVVHAGRRRLFTVGSLERFAREHEQRPGSASGEPPLRSE